MRYFSINEFCRSENAVQMGIDNLPNAEERRHVVETIEQCLDGLREAWGQPIRITSGYRCKTINHVVGGAANSSHMSGYAADIVPCYGADIAYFRDFCIRYFAKHPFDQLISEHEDKFGRPQWIHIGWKRHDGSQRRQVLRMVHGKYMQIKV